MRQRSAATSSLRGTVRYEWVAHNGTLDEWTSMDRVLCHECTYICGLADLLPPKEWSRNMGHSEASLVRELRKAIAELRVKNVAQERQIEELRDAVVALMEPGMPRILRTPGGIMVLDKKAHNEERSRH